MADVDVEQRRWYPVKLQSCPARVVQTVTVGDRVA